MISHNTARPWVNGFLYPECPRWHDDSLWFSDQHGGMVYRLDADGKVVRTIIVPGNPAGLGWLADGSLLVVSMKQKCLYRWQDEKLEHYADFDGLHGGHSNDMVVSTNGHAYIGNIGFDFYAGEQNRDTVLTLVSAKNQTSIVADAVNVPNGSVISEDGKTLIIAESLVGRLSQFTINQNGELCDRRLFAQLDGHVPDGICLDSEGCIWAASPFTQSVIRVSPDGDIIDTVVTADINPYACVFGGPDRKTLYICCASDDNPKKTAINKSGSIYRIDLAVSGAGIP